MPGQTPSSSRFYSIFLLLAAGLMLLLISHHPVASGTGEAARVQSMVKLSGTDQLIHGGAIALLLVIWTGIVRLGYRLGLQKPDVLLGLLSFSAGILCGISAMAFDGFALPWIAVQCQSMGTACPSGISGGLMLASAAVQAFTRLSLYMMALTAVAWSLRIIMSDPVNLILGWVGLASGLLQWALLAGPIERLTPHTLLAILGAQLIWYLAVAWYFFADADCAQKT